MGTRNLSFITAAAVALALLAANSAQAQTTWTCQEFTTSDALGTKLDSLAPDAQLSAKIVVRQFQTVVQLQAAPADSDATSVETQDAAAGAKKPPIPGAKLSHMVFADHYNLLLEDGTGSHYNALGSPGDVANALNDLPVGEADDAKVVIEQFRPQLKGEKHTKNAALRLINQYIMFYLAPFSEAQANACGSVSEPSPTPTSAATPTPTTAAPTPTVASTVQGLGTPTPPPAGTQTATPVSTQTPFATLTATQGASPQQTPTATPGQPAPTPTQPCVTFGGAACGPATPTPFFSSPTPTAACVQFGGAPCAPTPTALLAAPTPTQKCVQFGGQPCATPTPGS